MARISDYLERVIPSGPKQEVGIGNFTAFVRVRDSSELSADVPAVPLEDGTEIHDHIILKPIVISIEGDVSDIHLRGDPAIRQIQRSEATIGNLAAQYAPAWTTSMIEQANAVANDARDAMLRLENLISSGAEILSLFGNQDVGGKTIREQFVDAMEALHAGRQLITIDMPYRRRENMVITSFVTTTDNETDDMAFTLRAQQVRFAEVVYSQIARRSPGVGGQLDRESNKGTQEGTPVERSLLSNIFGG